MSILSPRGLALLLAAAVIGAVVAIEAQKPQAPPAQPAAAKPADAAKPGGSFDRYRSPQEANAALVAINQANPAQTALHKIAASPGGVDPWSWKSAPTWGRSNCASIPPTSPSSKTSSRSWRGSIPACVSWL